MDKFNLHEYLKNNPLLKENESMSMDGLKKLADIKAPKWKKKYKLDQTPDELVDLVMRSVDSRFEKEENKISKQIIFMLAPNRLQ